MDSDLARSLLLEAERSDQLAGSELVRRLAVMGTFNPERLEHEDEGTDVLRLLCRRLPSREDRPEAILSDRRRIDAMADMLGHGGMAELERVRRATEPHYNSPLQHMLDAFVLNVAVPVEDRDEDELLASLNVWQWATEAVARARSSREVVIEPSRELIESRLAIIDITRAVRKLAADGCIGRDEELAQLHGYRKVPPSDRGLVDEPAMVVYGIGGVGKSTLMARYVMDLFDESERGERQAWAYLDLDRPTLSSCEPDVVLADIVRQVAAQFPEYRRTLERGELLSQKRETGAGLESAEFALSYRERANEFARAIRGFTNGSLLVILDTFEELERNRPEMGRELYGLFATLASELPQLKLVVSGRSPAATFLDPSRADRQLDVLPLQSAAALELLRFFVGHEAKKSGRQPIQLDDQLGLEIIELVGGIPLTVRLAARVLVQEGPAAIADAADRARTLDRVRTEFVRGFLYQRILEHIIGPVPERAVELRRVARASIALRRVTVGLVEHVLLPSIEPLRSYSADELFEALASEVAFAERDGNALQLREELRGPALAALRFDDPHLVQRVHDSAADFYATAPNNATSVVELTYHRLARGDPAAMVAATVDVAVLRQLEPSLADLPQSSATVIRQALHDQAGLSALNDLVIWERRILPQVDAALRSGDLRRARDLLEQRQERSGGTELHRLESRLEEAEGNLDGATVAAHDDLKAAAAAADPTRFAAAAVRLAALHELRGQVREAEAALREAADSPLLTGYVELRLELLLNRMNTRERARLDSEDSRWSLGLDARALIQRSDPRSILSNTALLRLMAAALGREEPERIRDAGRRIGLGHDEDPGRVQALVNAIVAWDTTQPERGRLARLVGLRVYETDPDGIKAAWTSGLAGLGIDAGLLLDRLWSLEPPPEPVTEAIRMLYLWWGVAPAQAESSGAVTTREHFLTQDSLDWSSKEVTELMEILITVYPTSTERVRLADRAGLDPKRINWSDRPLQNIRSMVDMANRTGRLDDLVAVVLTDVPSGSIHERLRSLLGKDWLERRHL